MLSQLIKRLVAPQQGVQQNREQQQQQQLQLSQSSSSLMSTDEIPKLRDDELMDVDAMTDDESKLAEEEDPLTLDASQVLALDTTHVLPLDATFVIEREAIRSSPRSLTAENEMSETSPRPPAAKDEAPQSSPSPLAAVENKTPPQLSPRPLANVLEKRGHAKMDRFAKKHEEHFAQMLSIDVAAAKTEARKKKLLEGVSTTSNVCFLF